MFDLNTAIKEWRQQMLDAGITAPEPLEELELHLREDVEKEIRFGTSAPKAFDAAVLRIGPAAALKTEFKKAGATHMASLRKRLHLFLFAFACLYLAVTTRTLLTKEMSSVEQMSGFAAIAASLLLGWGGFHLAKRLPVFRGTRAHAAACVGIVLLAALFPFAMGAVLLPMDFASTGQLTAAFLWALSPWLALTVCIVEWSLRMDQTASAKSPTTA